MTLNAPCIFQMLSKQSPHK